MCVCVFVCVFKWGKPRERIERKDHLASAESVRNKSLEKREKKGEKEKREKVVAVVLVI